MAHGPNKPHQQRKLTKEHSPPTIYMSYTHTQTRQLIYNIYKFDKIYDTYLHNKNSLICPKYSLTSPQIQTRFLYAHLSLYNIYAFESTHTHTRTHAHLHYQCEHTYKTITKYKLIWSANRIKKTNALKYAYISVCQSFRSSWFGWDWFLNQDRIITATPTQIVILFHVMTSSPTEWIYQKTYMGICCPETECECIIIGRAICWITHIDQQ